MHGCLQKNVMEPITNQGCNRESVLFARQSGAKMSHSFIFQLSV